MNSLLRRSFLTMAALGLISQGAGTVRAGVLLDLVDPSPQYQTPISLTFVAGVNSTPISFAGYNVPASELVEFINLSVTGGGVNLLGDTWDFTPASLHSDAFTFSDGTSVPALLFAAFSVGEFDTFTQTIATDVGQSYTLSFLYTNNHDPSIPSELVVSAGDATLVTAVPEPATMASLGLGLLAGTGALVQRRRKQARPCHVS